MLKLISRLAKPNHNLKFFLRSYSNSYQKELTVPTFCDVQIDLPYNIDIKPLNIHKYQNCDKLIVEIDGSDQELLQHSIDGNLVKIFSKSDEKKDIVCNIQAPIKANLNITSSQNITAGFFNGDNFTLTSVNGNITVDKFQGNLFNVTTTNGDINLKESIQSSKINATVLEKGSVFTEKLQGNRLELKTNQGNISIGSSYCKESKFSVKTGDMKLQNIHEKCQISLDQGNLNLVGFDGRLYATLNHGNADIQLSRIFGKSYITIMKSGSLDLKVSEECSENVDFEIKAKECSIAKDLKFVPSFNDFVLLLTPELTNEDNSTVCINCLHSVVNITKASWGDMFKLKN